MAFFHKFLLLKKPQLGTRVRKLGEHFFLENHPGLLGRKRNDGDCC